MKLHLVIIHLYHEWPCATKYKVFHGRETFGITYLINSAQ